MGLRFVGDVHGKIKEYLQLISKADCSIQLGDMGLGFRGISLPELSNHYFIRGNHDSPDICRGHANHLGDWGFRIINGRRILYVAGGYSLDQDLRIPGVSWWPEEELSYEQYEKILDFVEGKRIQIVVSHEAPAAIVQQIFPGRAVGTRTSQGLEAIRCIIKPKLWMFGHYHLHWDKKTDDTRFIGLDELEYLDY